MVHFLQPRYKFDVAVTLYLYHQCAYLYYQCEELTFKPVLEFGDGSLEAILLVLHLLLEPVSLLRQAGNLVSSTHNNNP